jgi:hypothetical protein
MEKRRIQKTGDRMKAWNSGGEKNTAAFASWLRRAREDRGKEGMTAQSAGQKKHPFRRVV